jgi:multicomponent Na+:H+ antiporter subunit E
MNLFFVNVILALIWALVTGVFSVANLIFGFVLGIGALYLIQEQVGSTGYLPRMKRVTSLALLFLYELLLSGWRVAVLVLSPDMKLAPGIIAYPLRVDRDIEITLLANLITLTPGTLSVDVSEDRRTLYIHALDCADPDGLRNDIAEGFERKILEALR